jgi:hypothetical protein
MLDLFTTMSRHERAKQKRISNVTKAMWSGGFGLLAADVVYMVPKAFMSEDAPSKADALILPGGMIGGLALVVAGIGHHWWKKNRRENIRETYDDQQFGEEVAAPIKISVGLNAAKERACITRCRYVAYLLGGVAQENPDLSLKDVRSVNDIRAMQDEASEPARQALGEIVEVVKRCPKGPVLRDYTSSDLPICSLVNSTTSVQS